MFASEAGVQPLMYGYMRVMPEDGDDQLGRVEQQMRAFAETEGFYYATTFFEYTSGVHRAYDELAEELKRAEAHHVITPSLSHISAHPILRDHMVERLEHDADAVVFELSEP